MCEHCGAPLTPYAHSDPVMGIMARGFAAHKATTNPQKPIVVIGIWLWMLPLLVLGLSMARFGMGIVVQGLSERDGWGVLGVLAISAGAGIAWIAGAILVKTTFRYLETTESKEETEKREETTECLQCGQSFAADADACPKCGWTYTGTELD